MLLNSRGTIIAPKVHSSIFSLIKLFSSQVSLGNVEINLGFLKDKNLVESVKEEILHIRTESNKLKEEILKESGFLQN